MINFINEELIGEIPVRRLDLNGIKIFNSHEYLIFPLASYAPSGNRTKPNAIHFNADFLSV